MSVQPETSKALNSTGTNQRHKCEKLMQFLLVRIHFEVVYPPLNTNREGLLFDQTWLSNRDLIILAFNSTVVFSSFERCSSSSSLLPKWGEKEKKKKKEAHFFNGCWETNLPFFVMPGQRLIQKGASYPTTLRKISGWFQIFRLNPIFHETKHWNFHQN